MTEIKILMVDDHPIIIEGYQNVLMATKSDSQVLTIETANNCDTAQLMIERAADKQPYDVCFFDISLPGSLDGKITSGEDLAMLTKKLLPNAKIIILTMFNETFRIHNIINEINLGMAATAPGVKPPGSNTFQNLSMGNLIGRVFSESLADNTTLRTMTRPLDWLYKLPDQQVQELLVQAMLGPEMAVMMMGKANVTKVEPLAKSLREKAIQLGYGTTIGATQGQ